MSRSLVAILVITLVVIVSCTCLCGQYPIQRWILLRNIDAIEQLEMRLLADPSDSGALEELQRYAKRSHVGGGYAALRTFGRIDATNFNEVQYLASFLQHQDHGTKRAAALAIKEKGDAAVDALPELIAALDDVQAVDVRVFAAETLGNLGPKAVDSLPALEKALKDPDNGSFHSIFETAIEKIRQPQEDATEFSK